MATFGDHDFGHYREVALIEELFCTQTVYLGPDCLAIIEKLAFPQRGHYREVSFYMFILILLLIILFCRITEVTFWHNYFYRVFLVKQSSQLASLAAGGHSATTQGR